MGLPAVSLASSSRRRALSAGFFYQGLAPAAGAAHAPEQDPPADQFAAALGDSLGMQADPRGGAVVAAGAPQQRGQAGAQAALALVEHTDEAPHESGQLGRMHARGQRQGEPADAPGGDLPALALRVGRAVQGASVDGDAGQLAVRHQALQGDLRADADQLVEFARVPAARGALGQGDDRGAQRAVRREADGVPVPQAVGVEAGVGAQGVVVPAMGVTGEGADFAQLAGDGAWGGAVEGLEEIVHGGHVQVVQGGGHGGGGEGNGAHGLIMA